MLAPLALSFNQSPILAIPASLNDLVSSGLKLKMDWQSGLVYLMPFRKHGGSLGGVYVGIVQGQTVGQTQTA